MERTLAIIKPDAFASGHTGKIIDRILAEGFRIRGMKKIWLTAETAGDFYHVHRDKPFFADLAGFMSSGPSVALVLEREEAILGWRELMGATNPANAAEGTIRKDFALSIGENSVHGSDAPETAAEEIAFFFSGLELVG